MCRSLNSHVDVERDGAYRVSVDDGRRQRSACASDAYWLRDFSVFDEPSEPAKTAPSK